MTYFMRLIEDCEGCTQIPGDPNTLDGFPSRSSLTGYSIIGTKGSGKLALLETQFSISNGQSNESRSQL